MKLPKRRTGGARHQASSTSDVDLYFSDHSANKPDYHTQALCKQVQRTLATVLSGECGDPLLQDLQVLQVLPAPNAGHLLVLVAQNSLDASLIDILDRLGQVTPFLRARLARDLSRKRTPELSFNLLPRGAFARPDNHIDELQEPPAQEFWEEQR